MPDPPKTSNDETTLGVPGILCVTPTPSGKSTIRVGPAAGWMVPRGIANWEHELSFVARSDATAELARALRATLPREQVAPKRFPMASQALAVSPFLALSSNLVADARKEGVRVHTLGVDRVSAGFYYFAEGGAPKPVQVQGNLIEMLAPSLGPATTNAEIAALSEGLLDRLLSALSDGAVSDLEVELADALPRLSRDGTGLVGTDLETFEAQAGALASRSARWEAPARRLVEALAAATRRGESSARVPLYAEASQETLSALEVHLGEKPLRLPARSRWTVSGSPRDEITAAAAPAASNAIAREPTASTATSQRADPSPRPRAVIAAPRPRASSTGGDRRTPAETPPVKPTPSTAASTEPVAAAKSTDPPTATAAPAARPAPETAPVPAATELPEPTPAPMLAAAPERPATPTTRSEPPPPPAVPSPRPAKKSAPMLVALVLALAALAYFLADRMR